LLVSDKEIALNDCGSGEQSSLYFLQRGNARKQIELAMKIVFVSFPEFKSKHILL
jgi:hypothetical protein